MKEHDSTKLHHERTARRDAPGANPQSDTGPCMVTTVKVMAPGVVSVLLATRNHHVEVGDTGVLYGIPDATVVVENVTRGYARGRITHEGIERMVNPAQLVVLSPDPHMAKLVSEITDDDRRRRHIASHRDGQGRRPAVSARIGNVKSLATGLEVGRRPAP